ncbi:hypothetical protein NEISICOT_02054 [Neisseria sicca ATCC 29256]|uniref:Uncharacterized protein n=1 Tax=Neisseria sicca ATCC 29256 TaxID=547045 RepID=C6M6A3_NEISI|nr:hypothetical protein NEISICOT_02054 [Neisseria sicca ATCC 29256]
MIRMGSSECRSRFSDDLFPSETYSGLTKSGQGDEAADSTDSTARQRRTGLKLIHYTMEKVRPPA